MKSALVRYLGTHLEGPKWNFCGLSMESRGVFQSAHPVQARFEFQFRELEFLVIEFREIEFLERDPLKA